MTDRAGWTPSPETRGTSDIIWGSFVTLGLCVWTAVHPNIELETGQMHDLGVRLLMMLVAVIFPEVLISAAWHQRVLASKLTKTSFQSFRNQSKDATAPYQAASWNLPEGFFAVMGGFTFQHTYLNSKGEFETIKSIFTTDAIQLMRELDLSPQLTKDDVEERSNADLIAKVIVIMQVLWFAVHIIARLSEHLAITALEVHTIVHVGCAIVMYALWWDKPYAVNRSIVLHDHTNKSLGSLFLFSHLLHKRHQNAHQAHELLRQQYWEQRALKADQALIDHNPPPEPPQMASIAQALATYDSEELDSQSSDSDGILLQSLAKPAYAGFKIVADRDSNALDLLQQPEWRGVRHHSEKFTLKEVWGSWTTDVDHEMSTAKVTHYAFNLLYGGGHLTAWHSSSFPTEAEAVLWRASSILVAALFTYGSIWVLFWAAARSKSRWALPIRRGDLNIFMGPFFCIIIMAYIGARCYFLVESLISLRSLPPSAYETVQWLSLFPHSS